MTSAVNDQTEQAISHFRASQVVSGISGGHYLAGGLPEHLMAALELARDSRALIPTVQQPLFELHEAATDPVEKNARLFQIDLAAWQLNRAADLAEARLLHLPKILTKQQIDAENERCSADSKYWFDFYAWGVDPRPDAPLSVMPFGLFPFQERFVEWLDFITFVKRVSGVVEKARDMGATETVLRWMWHKWRYRSGFIGMVLSANEDLVDSKKDPSTLFEKLRFQTRNVPLWMLPKDFDLLKDLPYMLMQNPDNDSVIIGDAPTPNVGRQRRAAFVLGDEYAAWQQGGYPQYAALSRTTNTFCPVSSVQGKFNKFSDLAHEPNVAKFEMDWRDHPWRDSRWYDALKFGYVGAAMTDEEIAQEIDRNYEASQPGRVLKNVREEYCFINWQEFTDGFTRLGRNPLEFYHDDRPALPDAFNWGRVSDYGESARTENDTHIWAYSLFARPPLAFPLSDSLFFFFSLPIEPIGATELEGFAFYSGLETELGLRVGGNLIRQPTVNDMSHEATDPKDVLLKKCGDNWKIPDLDFDKGRRKLVFHFEIIDKHLPNPFRPDLMGRCRIYFVALPRLDGQQEYFMARNERTNSYFVTPSATQRGFKRLRSEMASWHYPPEERGKPVPKMRPRAVFDDVITTVRYAVARWGVEPAPLNLPEQFQQHLEAKKPAITNAQLANAENETEKAYIYNQQQHELQKFLKEIDEKRTRMLPRSSKFRRRE